MKNESTPLTEAKVNAALDRMLMPREEQQLVELCSQVAAETRRATKEHGGFNSHHEAYGVLLEEVDEYWDEVKKKAGERSKERMREELIQVAAVALKAVISLT